MNGTEANINLSQYAAQREKGVTKIVNIEGQLHYVQRRFHPEEGTPQPLMVPITLEALKKAREQMGKDISALDQVIADAETALAGKSAT